MTRCSMTLWALWSLLAAGCAGSGIVPPPPEPRALGRDLPTYVASGDPDEPEVPQEEPSGDLSLRQALALAQLRNPGLASAWWQIRVREAQSLQAGLRPNPEVGIELENAAGSGTYRGLGGSETTVSLSQVIELGGKRGSRRLLAGLDRNLSAWDHETRRLDLLTEVARAFVSVLAAQERVRISQDLVTVAERSLEAVSLRIRAGAVSPAEEARARVAVSSARLDLESHRRRLPVERGRLAALWGSTSPRFDRAVGDLGDVVEPQPLDLLLTGVEGNPDVARWTTELARRRADLALQRSLGTPDVRVSGGLRHLAETSDRAITLGLEVPLPLVDRNQGNVRAAQALLAEAAEEQRGAIVTARMRAADMHERWADAYREITTLEREILPDARRALETARTAYEQGLFRLTDVLDTQRTLFHLRSRRTDALERYHHARAELERLTGQPLPDTGRP